MKAFKITINGNVYHVEVEEMNSAQTPATIQAPVAQQPVTQPPAPKTVSPVPAAQKKTAPAGATPVPSPLPGTVLKVNVSEGSTITKGQAVFIIEAMKMENEITAPFGGKVATVNVSAGTAVKSGDVLMTVVNEG